MATDRRLLLLITFCGVLLLTRCPPWPAASPLSTAHERASLEVDSNKPQVIRAELMHRDHPDSPLRLSREATGSAVDRYTAAAERQKARIARRLIAGGENFTTPISFGEDLYAQAEYVMTLYLGTPPQKFVVILDTGSNLVWVQCQPCTIPHKCYKEADPFFDPSASSSYSAVPCSNSACSNSTFDGILSCDAQSDCYIAYAYGTPGSGIGGVVSSETLAFSNTTEGIPNFLFGCMDNDTASFGTVDGLAGFGRGLSSLPNQLSNLTSSFNVFSYCLVAPGSNFTSPLFYGASNSNGLELVYTPILTNNSGALLYWVNMTGISVNGAAVDIPQASLVQDPTTLEGGTIMDSGTTLITLLPDVYTPVVEAFINSIPYPNVTVTGLENTLCYNGSAFDPTYNPPNATLYFSGVNGTIVDFLLTVENLYEEFELDDNVTVLLCLAMGTLDSIPNNIIGNYAQADHYLQYDLVNERIGWTPSLVDCSSFQV